MVIWIKVESIQPSTATHPQPITTVRPGTTTTTTTTTTTAATPKPDDYASIAITPMDAPTTPMTDQQANLAQILSNALQQNPQLASIIQSRLSELAAPAAAPVRDLNDPLSFDYEDDEDNSSLHLNLPVSHTMNAAVPHDFMDNSSLATSTNPYASLPSAVALPVETGMHRMPKLVDNLG
jgi:hypothetical protein